MRSAHLADPDTQATLERAVALAVPSGWQLDPASFEKADPTVTSRQDLRAGQLGDLLISAHRPGADPTALGNQFLHIIIWEYSKTFKVPRSARQQIGGMRAKRAVVVAATSVVAPVSYVNAQVETYVGGYRINFTAEQIIADPHDAVAVSDTEHSLATEIANTAGSLKPILESLR
jgi:hypothetical protein